MTQKISSTLLLGVTLALLGCGGQGEVSGVVTYQGKPVPAGTISFYDERSRVWSSAIGPDGSYAIPNMPTGLAKITVVVPMAIGHGNQPPPKITPLPDKYADREKSGLTYQVVCGSQTHAVDLE